MNFQIRKALMLLPLLLMAVLGAAQQKPSTKKTVTGTSPSAVSKTANRNTEQLAEENVEELITGTDLESTLQPIAAPKQFPRKNAALLAAVTPTPVTTAEVIAYVISLRKLIHSKLPATAQQQVQKSVAAYAGDAIKMGTSAVLSWYNGATKESLVLAAEACIKAPDDLLLVNNLAALLNLSGGEYKALPLLRKLAQELPRNSMVLNNIGQAYAGIGELDSAMVYFARCTKVAPNHPEANNTAGQIEEARGNTEKAQAYYEKSSRGAITSATIERMNQNMQSNTAFYQQVSRHVRPRVKLPDIFNAYKYQLKPQIKNVEEGPAIWAEHLQFEDFLHNVLDMYADLQQQEHEQGLALEEKNAKLLMKDPFAAAKDLGRFVPPFAASAAVIFTHLSNSYQLRRADIARYREEKEQQIYKLQLQYDEEIYRITKEEYAACLEATKCKNCNPQEICDRTVRCPKSNKAADAFLSKAAAIREDIQRKELALAREAFENLSYFGYLSGANKHYAKEAFYKACYDYVAAVLQADETAFIAKCNEEGKAIQGESGGSDNAASMDCPINIKLDVKIGEVELACDKFKIAAFGGVLKGSRDKETRQSTLAFGVELKGEKGVEWGGIEGAVEIAAEQTFYLTFDEHNSVVDGGMAVEVEASAEVGTGNDIGGEVVKGIEIIKKVEAGFGYTLGVNSGWTFNEGILGTVLNGSAPAGSLNQFAPKK